MRNGFAAVSTEHPVCEMNFSCLDDRQSSIGSYNSNIVVHARSRARLLARQQQLVALEEVIGLRVDDGLD